MKFSGFVFVLYTCAGFGWSSINFLHTGWRGALFWICAERSDDDVETQSQDVFWFLYCQAGGEGTGGSLGDWEETQLGEVTPTDQRHSRPWNTILST